MNDLPDGWLTKHEAEQLSILADGLTVLELGAWKGRSTVALARTAAYVVSIDRHEGIVGHGDSLQEYLLNVFGLPNVAVVVADWTTLGRHLGDFDMVYIDGDHDRASVERDIDIAVARHPSLVVFHDWDFPEVQQAARAALDEWAEDDPGEFGGIGWYRL